MASPDGVCARASTAAARSVISRHVVRQSLTISSPRERNVRTSSTNRGALFQLAEPVLHNLDLCIRDQSPRSDPDESFSVGADVVAPHVPRRGVVLLNDTRDGDWIPECQR